MQRVYVFRKSTLCKIGIAADPHQRLRALKLISGSSRMTLAHMTGLLDNAGQVERRAHQLLKDNRAEGEWFRVSAKTAIAAIEQALTDEAPKVEPPPPSLDHMPVRLPDQVFEALRKRQQRPLWNVIDCLPMKSRSKFVKHKALKKMSVAEAKRLPDTFWVNEVKLSLLELDALRSLLPYQPELSPEQAP